MLSSVHRLRGDAHFKRLMRSGRPIFQGALSLRFAKQPEGSKGPSRFAFAISTKVSKKAVVRNKLRRRLREIIRADLSSICPGYDILISTRSEAVKLSFQELTKEIQALLRKARLYL